MAVHFLHLYENLNIHVGISLEYTVLCTSNANEFRRNSRLFVAFRRNFAWNDISMKFLRIFMTPIVLIHTIFRTIVRFAQWFTANFRTIIRSFRKVVGIFRTIIRSSRKFDHCLSISHERFRNTLCWAKHINDLSDHWAQRKLLIFRNSITARGNVSYETHLAPVVRKPIKITRG